MADLRSSVPNPRAHSAGGLVVLWHDDLMPKIILVTERKFTPRWILTEEVDGADDGYPLGYAATKQDAERQALAWGDRGDILRYVFLDGLTSETDL